MRSLLRIISTLSLLLLCFCAFPGGVFAQAPPSSVIDPSRVIDWSLAGAGAVPSGTPCATAAVDTTFSDTTNGAAIRSAIASCGTTGSGLTPCSGGYKIVSIPAGNHFNVDYISYAVVPLNNTFYDCVRVVGTGANLTFIVFTTGANPTGGGTNAVTFVNGNHNFSADVQNAASWTSGYSKGTTSITINSFSVGSIANLHVGSLIILDQLDDASDPGSTYICQTRANPGCSMQGGSGNGRPGRALTQTVVVTSISGSGPWTIGITPGLYGPTWNSGQSPGLWFSPNLPIVGDSLESMSLDYTALGGGGVGILIYNGYGNRIRNVRGINNNRSSHVQIYQSAHNTVEDSYWYGSNGTQSSYGLDPGYASSDDLIQNNICQHISTCEISEGSAGDVFAYNAAIDNYFTSANWQQQSNYHHSAGSSFTLHEGNYGDGYYGDDIHGTSIFFTTFRNYFSGRDPVQAPFGPKTTQTSAIALMAYSREENVIGNVLGTAGYHMIYQTNASSPTDPGNGANGNISIYVLGYSGNQGSCPYFSTGCSGNPGISVNNDTLVATTLYRWANYDTVNNAVRCVSGEVPSGLPLYAQAVPGSCAASVPKSFYLPSHGASAPGFWTSVPWPPIGPDVTGGNIPNVGGFANKTPSAHCALDIMGINPDGSSGVLPFDAYTICGYGTGGGGGGPIASLSALTLFFGPIVPHATTTQTVTLTNTGSANLVMASTAISGSSLFTIQSNTCTGTITPTMSCTTTILFSPLVVGLPTATLTYTNNASPTTQTVVLDGDCAISPSGAPPNGMPF